jgi:glycosyltransferase involved in cell wall biosynthesis
MPDNVILTCQTKEEFVKKLQELNDDGIRNSIGKEFQKIVKIKYNADIEIKKLIKVYKEFLD